MAKYKTVLRYSKNVHEQVNPNDKNKLYRNGWSNPQNASSIDAETQPKGAISSKYGYSIQSTTKPKTSKTGITKTAKTVHKTKPWTVSAHWFDLNIPCGAYINNLEFTVRIRVAGNINVKAPYARFNIYHGTKTVKTTRNNDTGWDDGYWMYNPNKKLTKNYQDIKYVLTGTELNRRGYPISSINDIIMGIDLIFYQPSATPTSNHTVDIQFVSCKVDYELPDQILTFDRVTSENNPRITNSGEEYDLYAYYRNNSNASCCDAQGNLNAGKVINVKLPPNATARAINGDYRRDGWHVQCSPNANATLHLKVKDYSIGEDKLIFSGDVGTHDYWVYSSANPNDVGEVFIYPETIQHGVNSCIEYRSTVNASDGEATFYVNVDTEYNSKPSLTWSIVSEHTSKGVSIDTDKTNDNQIVFKVPAGKVVDIAFKSCFTPKHSNDSNVSVKLDANSPVIVPYKCLSAPVFKFTNNPSTTDSDRSVMEFGLATKIIEWVTHRVTTSTELGAFVIDCSVADFDKDMRLDDCTLKATIWDKLDYIGMIPLEYHHYDPKATFENKAISNSYKNKTYKGKEGIIDENISLQFKVRPPQATTLEGLVEWDKPTPINANHRCFEGDVLNHRGWVVLSKVEVEKTNPLWYDVDATVDYITHDINTKFLIERKKKVNNIPMSDVMGDIVNYGDNLSNNLKYFNVDTDGGFVYLDEENSGNNLFSLDNNQHLTISTRNPLKNQSGIGFDWYTTLNQELTENRMSRVFRLRDKTGQTVFEYEYTNFDYSDDHVVCDVIIRYLTLVEGWQTNTYRIDLRTELEADPIEYINDDEEAIYDNSSEETEDDVEEDPTALDTDDSEAYPETWNPVTFDPNNYDLTKIYGSRLELRLSNNQLVVSDAGYNGREVYEVISLVDKDGYVFESEWVNNNRDSDSIDLVSYIDVLLMETILDTNYANNYSNMYISPFPVPHKKLLFTRESEEGTIFYYNDDGNPFKYRIEPFYQYHCGTDLVTRDGISLFNLNNSYTYYYIENGLVRLGFNKYSGSLYLAKWDIITKQWITTHYFHMDNDIKWELASYSDDKITIKAGNDTYFTIWRGHPYVMINHPTQSIKILSKFNYCFSDKIDGDEYGYPVIYTFMNTDNLLPSCIGGNSIDYDCITVTDDLHTSGTNHTITVNPVTNAIADTPVTLSVQLDPSTTDGEVHYIVDDVDVGYASSPFNLDYPLSEGEHTVFAVYTGDDDDNIAISNPISINSAPKPLPEGSPQINENPRVPPAGHFSLKIKSAPDTMTYRDGSTVVVQLLRGGQPVPGAILEKVMPWAGGIIYTSHTDINGCVYIVNDDTRIVPGSWKVGARLYDTLNIDNDSKLYYSALKTIKVKKATPTLTHNASNGKVRKGNSFTVKLNGVDALRDKKNAGLKDRNVTVVVDGTKKVKTTNSNGKVSVKCNNKGHHKITVSFAGSTRYNSVSRKFNIQVV